MYQTIPNKQIEAVQFRGTLDSATECCKLLAHLSIPTSIEVQNERVKLTIAGMTLPKYMFVIKRNTDFAVVGASIFTECFSAVEEAKPAEENKITGEATPENIARILAQLKQQEATPKKDEGIWDKAPTGPKMQVVLSPEQEELVSDIIDNLVEDIQINDNKREDQRRQEWDEQYGHMDDDDEDYQEFEEYSPLEFINNPGSLTINLNGRDKSVVTDVLDAKIQDIMAKKLQPPKIITTDNTITLDFR